MTRFIDDHREQFGVTAICDVLGWNVSTYYAHRRRPPSDRALRDDHLAGEVRRVFEANYRVYGYRKVHAQLNREGFRVAECTVRRLMRREGLAGAVRGWKKPRTTTADATLVRPPDLLDRDFTAEGPDRRWVADLTYVRLTTGRFVYAAVIADVFSRKIVGWAVADHLRTELSLTALRQALWERRHVDLDGLIHHSDAGGQYVAVRYGEELAAAGIVPSIGSVGDSYDNAMAESTIGLVKPSSSTTRPEAPGRACRASSSRSPSTSTGSTTLACTASSSTAPRPRSRPTTTVATRQPRWPESTVEALYRTRRGSEKFAEAVAATR
jgi:putative transposase